MYMFPWLIQSQGGHSMFGSGGGMTQSRHQPSVPPLNQSPGIRAQVPHQFLSPQVINPMIFQQAPCEKINLPGVSLIRREQISSYFRWHDISTATAAAVSFRVQSTSIPTVNERDRHKTCSHFILRICKDEWWLHWTATLAQIWHILKNMNDTTNYYRFKPFKWISVTIDASCLETERESCSKLSVHSLQ